ncbi:MAG: U32 family peptidase [Desulfobulbaceae bacterium]|nr:U32 family peptidase [Desulfobulbaceae bacterium]
MSTIELELLAPAKNLNSGIAAINHGADAVYIGGPLFGARSAASNTLTDIEKLVRFAHLFRARVYIALNTLFKDDELEAAVTLCHQLYNMGADALIIQDMGLLESDLPPIALHSSTQMNNRTPAKVQFLEKVGFQQVVLARELSLTEIRQISAETTVPLEFFVHGALCVSYSGQCYISEIVAGRSANRGECAQFCRHKFNLMDRRGQILKKDRYLLSLKDLDLSVRLADLIDAGITSFKIEGRLKDESYVKNVTAYYRKLLDGIVNAGSGLSTSSSGSCRFDFVPDPEKSFHRGKTEYFLSGRRNVVGEIRTPKATGKLVGLVRSVERQFFTLSSDEVIHNGDGLCFFDQKNKLTGIRVNRVEDGRLYPKGGCEQLYLIPGTEIYRNSDMQFNKLLSQSDQCRSIDVVMRLEETREGLQLLITDVDGVVSVTKLSFEKEQARKPGSLENLAIKQLKKSGGTIFSVIEITTQLSSELFCPASTVNEIRRRGFVNHLETRLKSYNVVSEVALGIVQNNYPWPGKEITYQDNITNKRAEKFYIRHGGKIVAEDREVLLPANVEKPALMTTKYCVKAQLSLCPKECKDKGLLDKTLTLTDNSGDYELEFDCNKCEMIVRKVERKR